jgi:hypothetical protein
MIKLTNLVKEIVVKPTEKPVTWDVIEYPYKNTNIFLLKEYLAKLDELISSRKANRSQLDAINRFVTVLEIGWRYYDDNFDGDFNGDDAWEEIYPANLYGEDETGRTVSKSYKTIEKELEALMPGLSEEIFDLFMEGKQDYYND